MSRFTLVVAVWWGGALCHAQVATIEHVVVIGVDGLSPAGIAASETPHIDALVREGTATMHARAVMPTSSSSNWASMIMGAGPEQHGITSNDWERDKHEIPAWETGPEGLFPTIFGTLRQHKPDAVIGVFHDWDGFGRLVDKVSCDTVEDADGPLDATRRAVAFIQARRPTLCFVHLDHVDHAGHSHGWLSPEYVKAVEEADKLIGQMVDAVGQASLAERTLILVSADHGGKEKGHGGNTMAEIEIPWIASGAGVVRGRELKSHVNQYDTAATLAFALGAELPACWIARPVREAFVASGLTGQSGE
jgi:predicted AlkP superfamily pyrophosphatase or phosphodiesterase